MTNSPPRRDVVYAPVDHTCKDNNQQFIPDPSTTNLPAICQVLQTALTYNNNNDRLTAFDPGQPG